MKYIFFCVLFDRSAVCMDQSVCPSGSYGWLFVHCHWCTSYAILQDLHWIRTVPWAVTPRDFQFTDCPWWWTSLLIPTGSASLLRRNVAALSVFIGRHTPSLFSAATHRLHTCPPSCWSEIYTLRAQVNGIYFSGFLSYIELYMSCFLKSNWNFELFGHTFSFSFLFFLLFLGINSCWFWFSYITGSTVV